MWGLPRLWRVTTRREDQSAICPTAHEAPSACTGSSACAAADPGLPATLPGLLPPRALGLLCTPGETRLQGLRAVRVLTPCGW